MKYPLIRTFGMNICKVRSELDFTQQRVADMMEIDTRVVQRIEAGDTDPSFIRVIGFRIALMAPWDVLTRGLPSTIAGWLELRKAVEPR